MNRTILYYPTIDIPRNNWLRHSLLYWDEVSSIVPKSWDDKFLINLSPEIHYLLDEGQFRPIKPEDLISKGDNWQEFEISSRNLGTVFLLQTLEISLIEGNRFLNTEYIKIK